MRRRYLIFFPSKVLEKLKEIWMLLRNDILLGKIGIIFNKMQLTFKMLLITKTNPNDKRKAWIRKNFILKSKGCQKGAEMMKLSLREDSRNIFAKLHLVKIYYIFWTPRLLGVPSNNCMKGNKTWQTDPTLKYALRNNNT